MIKKVLKILGIILGIFVLLGIIFQDVIQDYVDSLLTPAYKPVIYLYPEEEMDITVKLDVDGELICTYPQYNGKWEVTAKPDGVLRVFMTYKALNEPIEVEAPEIENFEREGFTVIEWGGCEVEK